MTTLGWAGVGLLVAAGLALVVEGILAAIWGSAAARQATALAELLQTEQAMLEANLDELRLALEETKWLWRPYRIALRWLGHPLTIALWRSYLRRGLVR